MFVPPELVEVVLQQALGWIKQKTDSLLEKSQPAAIGYDEFKTEITAFVRKCSAREILVSWAGKPSAEDVEGDLLRTYVQQLELINCADGEQLKGNPPRHPPHALREDTASTLILFSDCTRLPFRGAPL